MIQLQRRLFVKVTPKSRVGASIPQPKEQPKRYNFDSEGKLLVMHHDGASKYYKMNLAFLLCFFGFTYTSFLKNRKLFFSETIGKLYLGLMASGVLVLFLFSNRHIRRVYLLKSGSRI